MNCSNGTGCAMFEEVVVILAILLILSEFTKTSDSQEQLTIWIMRDYRHKYPVTNLNVCCVDVSLYFFAFCLLCLSYLLFARKLFVNFICFVNLKNEIIYKLRIKLDS